MSTYAIGDIQGCFTELQNLLNVISFNSQSDTLWFTGDLVNRGSQSLETLRFIKSLGDKHISVLGNHDLHLIARAYGSQKQYERDTLDAILSAPDRDELIDWLQKRPLFYYDAQLGFALAHAGVAPYWTASKAKQLALEVEAVLQCDKPADFLLHMYGNQPDQWRDDLSGIDRLRCITNYFTRMRFCHADGRLELTYKGTIENKPADLMPWFDVPNRSNADLQIIFGHWAALGGKADVANVYPLDTGCVWGHQLTAMRLEDKKYFSVDHIKKRS